MLQLLGTLQQSALGLLVVTDAVMEMAGIAEGQLDADGMPILPGAGTGEVPYSIQVCIMASAAALQQMYLVCQGLHYPQPSLH
jgi:hypothetical protein